ncbi:hypothetical protein PC118_g7938 [Phytophthora cactorum]|uniref:Uncharacterized protein n=1 Tax=Phytophthora cactorum TaxID=29920 RepID=A0A8T1G4S8_9STRA|nr:hypothetical protein PC112_g19353 [Phytophthora cactorum]KAG2807602.1 hypothetical protein PC111_g16865 [Phytophthora cactorum]KAG2882397.1 hypothetical protein PC114_g21069 [Phytophthora cactorum]KAG2904842.1 hypothetical protein PC117_g20907 [Phytophthora cactorum]KAG2986181.1 hypothetical protein PC118_g7938 [Phytophthora cactorum]
MARTHKTAKIKQGMAEQAQRDEDVEVDPELRAVSREMCAEQLLRTAEEYARDQNGGGVRYPDALQKKLSIRPFNGK